ncbi:MAG: hypothetical protein CFE21_05875 [Bacteroidetes bacterium B1(2017)]|nr:MAG: hypothetical protein CFE21_05875 [Bacteroidetes bacterium B1(2017)]
MRKITLLLILLSSSTFSQKKSLELFIKSGVSHSTQQADYNPISHIRPFNKGIQGCFINLGLEKRLSPKISLTFGCQFLEKGFKVTDKYYYSYTENKDEEYQYRLNYLEAPLCINYQTNGRSKLLFGIVPSYLIHENYRYRYKTVLNTYITPTMVDYYHSNPYSDAFDRLNKWDCSASIGLNYKVYEKIYFEGTIQKGFVRIDKWKEDDLNYNFSFLLGLKYNLN